MEICSWFGQDAAFTARGAQNPFTHRDDQPVLFHEWNEDSGCDHAAARMVPADQRFETHDLAVDPGQRLIIEPQLVVGERGLQVVLQLAAVAQLRGHVGLEESDRIAPFGLGAVECHIRVGEEGRGVGPVNRTGCDADAQSNAQLSSGDLDVAAQRGPELQSQLTHDRGLRVADDDQDELVAANACQEDIRRNRLAGAARLRAAARRRPDGRKGR